MKNSILLSFVLCIIQFTSFGQVHPAYSNFELIVQFEKGLNGDYSDLNESLNFNNEEIKELNDKYDLVSVIPLGIKNKPTCFLLRFDKLINPISLSKAFINSGLFEYVEPNYIGEAGGKCEEVEFLPNDTYFDRQWGLLNDGSFGLSPSIPDADVDMELAWDIEQGDPSIVVAVLDSGIKLNHPEFEGRIWQNTKENLNGLDTDDNGYIDDVYGWDFANNDNGISDDHGHGTNVAGIIAAKGNNNKGYTGVDLNCTLMNCKILDQNGSGLYSWWGEAIYYAVDHGAHIINMSVGGSSESTFLRDAVNYAKENGVIIIACMMNNDIEDPYYPAGFKNTIAVGSTNPNDERTTPFFWDPNSGSQYGAHIDVVAPGNFIYGIAHNSNTNYNSYWGGTSQAAPLVAGLASLLLAQDDSRTFDDIRQILRNTAEDQVGSSNEDKPGFDKYYGYGRVNAYAALNQMTSAMNSINKFETFTIYPNPTNTHINLFTHSNINNISIQDILGNRVIQTYPFTQNNIDVSSLHPGSYVINGFNAQGQLIGKGKFVISR